MSTMPSNINYVVDESGKRTHVIMPIKLFEEFIEQNYEEVFVDIEEAESWLSIGLPETLDLTKDTIYNIKGCKSNASEDLSENMDDYLYGKDKYGKDKCKEESLLMPRAG